MIVLMLALFAQDPPTVSGVDFTKFPVYTEAKGRRISGSLADAVEKAAKGDVLVVPAGKHAIPTIEITKSIRIVGEGAVTLVPASGDVHEAMIIHGDDVVVENLAFEGFTGMVILFGREESTQKNLIFSKITVRGGSDAFRSIVVDGPAKRPLLSGLLLRDVRIENPTLVGFNVGEGPVTDIRIENLTVVMTPDDSGNSGADAIAVESGDNIFVRGCDVTGATADGIDLKATRVSVYDSVVHDVARNGIKLWKGGDVVNCLVYKTGADAAVVFGGEGTYRVLHTTVALHAKDAYAMTAGYDEPTAKGKLIIENSIFYKNGGAVWVSRAMEIRVTNSIFHGSGSGYEFAHGDDELDVTKIGRNWTVEPKFENWRLRKDSPGVDSGIVGEKHPKTDRAGKKRGKAPDLGPDEVRE